MVLVLVEVVAVDDGIDVAAGAGEGDGVAEIACGDAGAFVGVADPFVDAALAGVVFGEGEGDGIVAAGVMGECFFEIPCADFEIDAGGEEICGDEGGVFGFAGPIAGGGDGNLHEAALAVFADHIRAEGALAPDDGFDEHGIDAVFLADFADEGVVAVVTGEADDLVECVGGIGGEADEYTDGGQGSEEKDEDGVADEPEHWWEISGAGKKLLPKRGRRGESLANVRREIRAGGARPVGAIRV